MRVEAWVWSRCTCHGGREAGWVHLSLQQPPRDWPDETGSDSSPDPENCHRRCHHHTRLVIVIFSASMATGKATSHSQAFWHSMKNDVTIQWSATVKNTHLKRETKILWRKCGSYQTLTLQHPVAEENLVWHSYLMTSPVSCDYVRCESSRKPRGRDQIRYSPKAESRLCGSREAPDSLWFL